MPIKTENAQALYAARVKKLRRVLREHSLDAFVTVDPAQIRWLTGWAGVFDDEPAHLALITARRAAIHTDARYSEALRVAASHATGQAQWHINDERIGHFEYAAKALARSRMRSRTVAAAAHAAAGAAPIDVAPTGAAPTGTGHTGAGPTGAAPTGAASSSSSASAAAVVAAGAAAACVTTTPIKPCSDALDATPSPATPRLATPRPAAPGSSAPSGAIPGSSAPQRSLRLGFENSLRLDWHAALQKRFRGSGVKLVATSGLVAGLRAVKDAEELVLLKRAQRITDAAFESLLTWVKPGLTEQQVANRLEFEMRELGAEGLAFPSIVASGPNSALPHARPTTRKLRSGDFLLLDYGARYHDYCADMTRTLVLGTPSARQRRLHAAVLEAHEAAKAGLRAGITGACAFALANEVLAANGLAEHFTHSLGHGLGIEVHELPTLSSTNKMPLAAGCVVTVEPGVYLSGKGGVRIEDCGIVVEDGYKSFARSSRELICL